MSTRWYKVLRDLRTNKGRSILAVLAIAIGVAGFGSVLSAYSILTRELNAGYLATSPASATLWTGRIDELQRQKMRAFPRIAQAEERRSIGARIRSTSGDWKNAILFIIQDYGKIRVSKLKKQTGKWPPADGEILIERDAMGVARAKVGDEILVKMANGTERALLIAGTVHDASQAQARMEQIVYGYITLNTLKLLGEDPYFDEWKVIVEGDKFHEESVRATIAELKSFLEAGGYPVRRIDVPKPGKHPHADLMGTLLLFKSSFGLFALILSSVLIVNLLSALMAGQVRQIGIMKAIGARRSQIIGLYLGSVLILSIAALLLSIPLAIVAGRGLATFMSRFLNFDLQSYAIAPWVYALEFAAGLLIPLLASLYPVFKGSRITVREAISDYGINEKQFGARRTDRLIVGLGGVAVPILLSVRNTFRRRGRLALIVVTMAAGGTIFIAAWNVRASLIHTVDAMLSSFRYDLSISLVAPYPIEKVEHIIRQTPGIAHVESWAVAEADVITSDGSQKNPISMVAPAAGSKAMTFHIVQGRALLTQDQNALVINNALARLDPSFRIGNELTLRFGTKTQKWKVIGVARQPLAAAAAYANFADLSEFAGVVGRTKNVRVMTTPKDGASIMEIKRTLEENLSAAGIRAAGSVSMAERRRVIDEHNSVIYTFLIVMSVLIVIVGGLGLMTVMSINVLERRREIGVMRAIGATGNRVLLLILLEGSLIGILSWIVAVPTSALISNTLGNLAASRILRTRLEYVADPAGLMLWLLIVLLFGAAASFLPAWNASRNTVRELTEYE